MSRTTRSRRRTASAGFTLIEVVVALAIIAMVLVSIGSVIAASVRSTRAIDHRIALVETARSIETGLPDRDQLKVGSLSGETADHRWRVDVMPFPTRPVDEKQPEPWVPRAVAIRVQSPSGSIIRIDTLRLQRKSVR